MEPKTNTEVKPEERRAKIPVKRIVMWWLINPAIIAVLYFALFKNVEWCSNFIKFSVWVDFIIWLCVLFAGEKGSKSLKEKGLPVNAAVNGIYGLVFAGTLAAFGWFGYAGMKITTLISQQLTYFGSDT